MKKLLAYSLFMALMICSCQVEEIKDVVLETEPETNVETKVFTAIIEDSTSGETKTSLDGGGNVLWKQGDQVSIFAASTVNEQYQVTDESDGKTAASLNKVGGSGFVAGTEIDNNVAFYPYASTASIEKSGGAYVISNIELPATQNYAESSFGNGAFPMTAVTNTIADMDLKFKNVLGGLKLQLKGTATITSITVTGNNDEILCGDAEVTVAYGSAPSISLTDASAKTVTLDCGAGVVLDSETATPFIIALPPMTLAGGFTVVVTDSESKQMEISTSKSQTITRSSLLKMPPVNYVSISTEISSPLKFTSTGATRLSLTKVGSPNDISLNYKVNEGDWTNYTIGDTINLSNGDEVYFEAGEAGNAGICLTNNDYYKYVITGSGSIAASGSIMTLLDRSGSTTIPVTYCFYGLFYNCSKLTSAPSLPAITLRDNCYEDMFRGCTSLTIAPSLPATTLADYCYWRMFYGCTSLTTASALPATSLKGHCYKQMFYGCNNLTDAPIISATSLEDYCCSEMFMDCTNLTTCPALPATSLGYFCYNKMFSGCSRLTTALALPSTDLAIGCYYGMFENCSSLTTAPTLPAPVLVNYCYQYMFYGCTNLSFITMLAIDITASSCLASWVPGVAANGTFIKNKDATWNRRGFDGIPSGWTVITE